MRVSELPDVERPGYKLRYLGADMLSNMELIQLITGARDFEAAEAILSESGGLSLMRKMTAPELMKIAGVSEAAACRLIAASELGARFMAETPYRRQRIFEAEDVYKIFAAEFSGEKQEIVKALLLNAKYEVIGTEVISKGGIVSAIVQPRDVLRPAVKRGATGVIVVHNHPSGDPTPSADDLNATVEIEKAGEIIGIKLIDHIVIGMGRYMSVMDQKSLGSPGQSKSLVADSKDIDRGEERER